MLYVIHVSERQKKKTHFFFSYLEFIGMFRSVNRNKGESCLFLRYPLSPSLNLRMFYPSVWLLFQTPLPLPHARPHSVPQEFLLNKLAKINATGLLVFFCPSNSVGRPFVRSLPSCYHQRVTKPLKTLASG